MKKFKATVKSAEEITEVKGCDEFKGSINNRNYHYDRTHGRLAEKRLEFILSTLPDYDYMTVENTYFMKDWLKDFREVPAEVDRLSPDEIKLAEPSADKNKIKEIRQGICGFCGAHVMLQCE